MQFPFSPQCLKKSWKNTDRLSRNFLLLEKASGKRGRKGLGDECHGTVFSTGILTSLSEDSCLSPGFPRLKTCFPEAQGQCPLAPAAQDKSLFMVLGSISLARMLPK